MPAPPPKRRKVAPAKQPSPVDEINFDLNARHEFLTGFHKRKLQRAKHAQELAERKAKEERKTQRKKVREERQSDFHKAMAEHRKRMDELNNQDEHRLGSQNGSDTDDNVGQEDEWDGFADPPPVDYEDEYIDEDKHTTVTVEEVDLSRVDGLTRLMGLDHDDHPNDSVVKNGHDANDDERPREADKAKDKTRVRTGKDTNRPRKKKQKFTYESKAERKLARLKERRGNKKRAEARRSKS